MKLRKKQKIVLALLGTSMTLLLQGCKENNDSKKVIIGESAFRWASTISYTGTEKNGSISYNNLEKDFLRVVTYEYEGKALEPKLMAINFHEFHPMRGAWSDTITYTDLESGVEQIKYFYPHCYSEEETPEIQIGANLTILDEVSLFNYIIEENWLQEEYDVNELITFFNEKVKNKVKEANNEEKKRILSLEEQSK